MQPSAKPKSKKLLTALIIAGIIIIGIYIFVFLAQPITPEPVIPDQSPFDGAHVSAVMTTPVNADTSVDIPVVTNSPVAAATTAHVTTPASLVPSLQPTGTIPPVTSTSGSTDAGASPEPFTFSISPVTASAKPGETVSYMLRIDGGQGQTVPIHFTLKASALFFTQTYELGDEQPPFPKTVTYQFVVPGNTPSGITINGVVTAAGAGQTREQTVTLIVK